MKTGALMLVNGSHPCPEITAASLVPVGTAGDGAQMERRAAALLEQLIAAAGGWGQIAAVSGWRSRQEQAALWEQSLREHGADFTARFVARPGHSEHETGLAVDLGLRVPAPDPICPEFPPDGVCGNVRRLAARYGFILRYPGGKEHITGIAQEPWHFRYVGIPHAEIMERLSLTLEEYLGMLRRYPFGGKPFAFRSGAFRFAVSYLPDSQAAAVPTNCLQSGDNDGGIILTTWDSLEKEVSCI